MENLLEDISIGIILLAQNHPLILICLIICAVVLVLLSLMMGLREDSDEP